MSLRWARTYAHEENQPSAWKLYEHGAGGRGKRPQDPPKLTVVGFTRGRSGHQSNRPVKAPMVVIATGRVSSQAPSPTVVRAAGRTGCVSEVHS